MHSLRRDAMLKIIVFLAIFQHGASEKTLKKYFDRLNNETKTFNALGAEISWELSLHPNSIELLKKTADFQQKYLEWHHESCHKLKVIQDRTVLNKTQERMMYLLCRGPKYTLDEAKEIRKLLEILQDIYAYSGICVPNSKTVKRENLTSIEEAIVAYISAGRQYQGKEFAPDPGSYCMKGELDFNRIMSFSRNENVLRWTWKTWRDSMSDMKEPYQQLVNLENNAAYRNGYLSLADAWRRDLEIPNLVEYCEKLYQDVKPLYTLLHGVTRYFLRREYGTIVPERGPIPAHLLGDLWAQNWESLADLILPKTIDLNKEMLEGKVKWDINHMIERSYKCGKRSPTPMKMDNIRGVTNSTPALKENSYALFEVPHVVALWEYFRRKLIPQFA